MSEQTSAAGFDTPERAGLAAAMHRYARLQAATDTAARRVRAAIEAVDRAEGDAPGLFPGAGAHLFPDAQPPATKPGFTPAGLRAWNLALMQTGIEHADLDMLRQGKRGLRAVTPAPAAPPNGYPPDAAD
jgi:hypothetical protein